MFFRGCEQGFCSYFELVYDDLIVFVRAGHGTAETQDEFSEKEHG